MSSVIAKIVADKLLPAAARFSRSFDRLVHFQVRDAQARQKQARLIASLLLAPFVMTPAFAASLAQGASTQGIVAAACATFCGFWACAIAQSLTGRTLFGLLPGLMLFSIMLGLAMVLSGGLASPLALLLLAPFLEMRWIGKERGALGMAAAASLAAVFITLGMQQMTIFNGAPSIAQWAAPLVYALTLALRFSRLDQNEEVLPASPELTDEPANQTAALELDMHGHVLSLRGTSPDFAKDSLSGKGLFQRLNVADRVVFLKAISDSRMDGKARALNLRILGADGMFRALEGELAQDAEARLWFEFAPAVASEEVEGEDEAAERNSAQNRFLATVSHELRTPLNAIIGMSDMLAHEICGPLSNDRQREYVSLIRQSGDHLLSVVNTVLEVSKLEFGAYRLNTEAFAFADVAEFSARMLEAEANKKNVHLTLDLAADLPQLEADRRAVQQVVINLACNGVKFCRDNGHVTIAARPSGRHLVIRVTDDGIGIPADRIAELGQPFTQVHSNDTREGSGLGLALVKGLVGLHKGTVTIDSVVDCGTTVTVTLPLKAAGELLAQPENKTNEMQEEAHGSLRKAS